MGDFDRPIRRVRLYLGFQRFLSALVWSLTVALSVAAGVMLFEKLGLFALAGAWWLPLAVAGVIGVLAALILAWFALPNPVQAAQEIDQRFGLNERISTSLSLPVDLQQTPAGQAVWKDALAHLGNLDVTERFGLTRPRWIWAPLVPMLAALALTFLPDSLLAGNTAKGLPVEKPREETKKAVNQAIKAVAQNLAKQRDPKNLEPSASDKVLAELQKAVEDLASKPPADKQETLVALNKLADTVTERRKQIGSTEQMSRQLQQLKEMAAGPAEQFASDLAKGDFSKAADEMKKLQEKLASGKMSEEDKKELSKQLGQLQKQLDQMAGLEERKKQLEEARKKGIVSEQQYQDQKQKLDEQSQGMKSLQSLAQKMSEAQQQMAAGESQKAADAMKAAESELRDMASNASELEALDGAMADLQEAKESMTGEGMNQLGKNLEGMSGMMDGGNRPGSGQGMGRGRGQGDRSEAPDKTASYDSKVKQQITKGKAVLGGFADPTRQVRGESVLEVQGTVEAAASTASEALTDQKIPKSLKKHVQSYFDQVRKGE